MRAGLTTDLGGTNIRKAGRHHCWRVHVALLLLPQVQAFCSSPPASPASARPDRGPQGQRPPRLPKLGLGSFIPAPHPQLAVRNQDYRRVTPFTSSAHRTTTAVVGMGASSSRPGAASPQQRSALIGDARSGGGGYGAAASDSRLGASVSGETDPEDPGTGKHASPCVLKHAHHRYCCIRFAQVLSSPTRCSR